jgi:hypothetical protein
MRIFAPSRIAFVLLFLPFLANAFEAGNTVVSREFIAEPPTLISLGFEWQIDGDDNRNAEVAVFYREMGDKEWKQGMSLLRLQREPTISGPMSYTAPNMFAGSIFDLKPNTGVVYHVPEGGALKFMYGSSGILGYHNTLIAPARWMLSAVSNLHFRNNLILGRSEVPDLFQPRARFNPKATAHDTGLNFGSMAGLMGSPEILTLQAAAKANIQ